MKTDHHHNQASRKPLSERTFAHHYGAVGRTKAPERVLRNYPPLAWGVIKHVGRGLRRSRQRLDELHVARTPLAL